MRNILFIAIVSLFAFSACNRKTTETSGASGTKPTQKETSEKKVTTLDELKGKEIQTKELPADKSDLTKSQPETKTAADDKSYKTYYEDGYQKHNAGNFPGAISDFTKSIELNPRFSDAYNFRGLSKYKSGDKSGACADWKKASELGNSTAGEMAQRYCN